MDLAKAKSVVIVMLLAFNIFLLFNNVTYSKRQGIQSETIENVEKILKTRGVTLECRIPTASREAHRLEYGNGGLDRDAIAAKLLGESYMVSGGGGQYGYGGKEIVFSGSTSLLFTDDKPASAVDIGDDDKVTKAALKYLKDKGLAGGTYVVDALERSRDGSVVVYFIEEYDGFLVYDNYSTVTVTAKGITRLEYNRLQIKGFTAERVEDFAAAYQVLLANFKDGGKQVITDIDIGYKHSDDYSMNGKESVELLPVWRIKIKDTPGPLYLGNNETEENNTQND